MLRTLHVRAHEYVSISQCRMMNTRVMLADNGPLPLHTSYSCPPPNTSRVKPCCRLLVLLSVWAFQFYFGINDLLYLTNFLFLFLTSKRDTLHHYHTDFHFSVLTDILHTGCFETKNWKDFGADSYQSRMDKAAFISGTNPGGSGMGPGVWVLSEPI